MVLESRLLEKNESPKKIAQEIYDKVKNKYNAQNVPAPVVRRPKLPRALLRPRVMLTTKKGKKVRSRLRWSVEDEKVLIQYRAEHGNFKNITTVLPDRSNNDCMWHWRVMCRKNPELK